MEKMNEIIIKLKNGDVTNNDLEQYLDVNNIVIQYLCMNEIHNRKLMTDLIKNKLFVLAKDRKIQRLLWGYCIGDFAVALLLDNDDAVAEMDVFKELEDFDKNRILKLSNASKW